VETFGQLIRRRRQEKGWTLEKAGQYSKTSKGLLSGLESGRLKPSARKGARIAEGLGLDVKDAVLRLVIEKAPILVRSELEERVFSPEKRVIRMMEQYLRSRQHLAKERLQDAVAAISRVFKDAYPELIPEALRKQD